MWSKKYLTRAPKVPPGSGWCPLRAVAGFACRSLSIAGWHGATRVQPSCLLFSVVMFWLTFRGLNNDLDRHWWSEAQRVSTYSSIQRLYQGVSSRSPHRRMMVIPGMGLWRWKKIWTWSFRIQQWSKQRTVSYISHTPTTGHRLRLHISPFCAVQCAWLLLLIQACFTLQHIVLRPGDVVRRPRVIWAFMSPPISTANLLHFRFQT